MTTYSGNVGDLLVEFAGPAGVGGVFPTGWTSWTPPTYPGVAVFCWDNVGHALYIYEWSSSTWKSAGGGGGGGFSPFATPSLVKPTAASFTLNHSTSATAVATDLASGRGVQLAFSSSAGNQACSLGLAGPSSSAMTAKAFVQKNWLQVSNTNVIGVYLKDNTGKAVFFGYIQTATTTIEWFVNSFNSSLALGSNIAVGSGINDFFNVPFWIQVQIAGGNMVSSVSGDGENFQVIDTRTIASLSSVFNGTLSETGIYFFTGASVSPAIDLNIYQLTATTP